MNKSFRFALLGVCLVGLHLDAAVYKGQREYIKQCVDCHSSGQAFVGKKRIYEWEELMEKKGKPLAKIHQEAKEAQESVEYFESKRFEKMSKHLEDFFKEYAKDSGNVPACN
ncbi:MAG: cytochrome C [Sulfurimonadaceae bacterium]|jgi:hypothetical protein